MRFSLKGAGEQHLFNRYTGVNWPAEAGVQLVADRWVIFQRPVPLSHLVGTREESKERVLLRSRLQSEA